MKELIIIILIISFVLYFINQSVDESYVSTKPNIRQPYNSNNYTSHRYGYSWRKKKKRRNPNPVRFAETKSERLFDIDTRKIIGESTTAT